MPSLRILPLLLLIPAFASAQGPSYARQVQPIFARYCNGCHTGWAAPKFFFTGSHSDLLKAITPGDADKSLLVQHLEGKGGHKPMPPAGKRQPLPEEIDLVRAWIAAGARNDGSTPKLSEVAPLTPVQQPVAALVYSPDGKLLVAGMGARVLLLDPDDLSVRGALEGFDGRITALAFRPDGKVLAVASGRPGVIGEVAFFPVGPAGLPVSAPLRRITVHLDLVAQLAYSPDGKILATASYDRLVRLWDAETGLRQKDLRDHSDSVYGVGFSHDGKLLASAGADRAVKIWDVASGKRLFTLSEATDWVYAVAWHPSRPILAAGGVDRNVRVWDITSTEGKLKQAAFAHEGAVLRLAFAPKGDLLFSLGEDHIAKVWDPVRLAEKRLVEKQPEALHALAIRPEPLQVALGRQDGRVVVDDGKSTRVGAALDKQLAGAGVGAIVQEENAGKSPATGQPITLTSTIQGAIHPAGDTDFYTFEAKPGQEVGVRVTLPAGSKLEPVLELVDPRGTVVATSTNGLLGHVCGEAGKYAVGLRDREFRGEPGYTYLLKVGAVPVVTSVFPMGLPRGADGEVSLEGANLGGARKIHVNIPADAVPGSKVDVKVMTPLGPALGNPQVVVGEFPEETKSGALLKVPGTGNGRIEKPGQVDTWRFVGKKGQRLVIEVLASRAGSPLDSTIEILDAQGHPIPIATLRAVAKVYSTFRDHDSVGAGIRLESWNELAVNDHVLLGTELMRIEALPRNPDDDCRFFSEQGRRVAYLGTTPTHHPQGEPVYKVQIHPPGKQFPPNGLPVVTLFARNDDGGPGYDKDSRLFFDPPADGEYQVRIGDSRGQGSRDHNYRVTVRPPRPSFNVKLNPMNPSVSKGGGVPIEVTAERQDDFQGPITVEITGLPAGVTVPKTAILAGENTTSVTLFAAPDAVLPAGSAANFSLKATASIDGVTVEKVVAGGKPTVIEPGEIVTTTEQREVTIHPGSETRLTVVVERRQGFAGRIPIEVRGLPHGVRVLDVGLNGILITPRETKRTIVLYAEPWVQPTSHPIVVLAKREGKNTDHAASSVVLNVMKGTAP
jgi:mono/diheme cytochrome c family protein